MARRRRSGSEHRVPSTPAGSASAGAPTVQSSEPVDWYARLDQCASLDDVKRVVSALIPAHGGKDQVPEDLQATINAAVVRDEGRRSGRSAGRSRRRGDRRNEQRRAGELNDGGWLTHAPSLTAAWSHATTRPTAATGSRTSGSWRGRSKKNDQGGYDTITDTAFDVAFWNVHADFVNALSPQVGDSVIAHGTITGLEAYDGKNGHVPVREGVGRWAARVPEARPAAGRGTGSRAGAGAGHVGIGGQQDREAHHRTRADVGREPQRPAAGSVGELRTAGRRDPLSDPHIDRPHHLSPACLIGGPGTTRRNQT